MDEKKELILNSQQVSYIIASFLLLSFFVFVAGFYWGKKSVIMPIAQQLHCTTLADKIKGAISVEEEAKDENVANNLNDGIAATNEAENSTTVTKFVQTTYIAQIAGFSNKDAAQRYFDKLKTISNDIVLTTKYSKNSKGIVKKWYQITTNAFTNKSKLLELVNQIKKLGQLKGSINIVAANNNER